MTRSIPERSRQVVLRLYISGLSPRSELAVRRLGELRERWPASDAEVIDVVSNPEAAELANVLATPVLVKLAPPPARRVVGDLSDIDAVLLHLGLARRPRDDG